MRRYLDRVGHTLHEPFAGRQRAVEAAEDGVGSLMTTGTPTTAVEAGVGSLMATVVPTMAVEAGRGGLLAMMIPTMAPLSGRRRPSFRRGLEAAEAGVEGMEAEASAGRSVAATA